MSESTPLKNLERAELEKKEKSKEDVKDDKDDDKTIKTLDKRDIEILKTYVRVLDVRREEQERVW